MHDNNPEVLLKDSLFNKVVVLAIVAYLAKEPNKRVFRTARKYYRTTECEVTKSVMGRICQYREMSAEAAKETFKLLMSGDY